MRTRLLLPASPGGWSVLSLFGAGQARHRCRRIAACALMSQSRRCHVLLPPGTAPWRVGRAPHRDAPAHAVRVLRRTTRVGESPAAAPGEAPPEQGAAQGPGHRAARCRAPGAGGDPAGHGHVPVPASHLLCQTMRHCPPSQVTAEQIKQAPYGAKTRWKWDKPRR